MAVRIVTGTTPTYPRDTIRFRQLAIFVTADATYLSAEYGARTDAAGAFSITLPVPDTGTVPYAVIAPDGTSVGVFLGAGAATTLELLLAGAFASGTVPDILAVLTSLIDAHAATKASTSVLGHVKIDGTTITIDGNGVISGAPGTPSGPAGGVLNGTYPDPGFAVDMATQAELNSEATTRATDDSTLALTISNHAALTTAAHGEIVASTDPRLTDARAPLVHASSHNTVGGDAISALAASVITTGQLALARGGTNADLSATGGANQVVRQNSAGGVFTVSALAAADIPNLDAAKITTGTMAQARLGSGSASSTTYLRGDQTWATISGGGTIDGSGSAGQVASWVDSDTLTGSAGLLYDDTAKRLSIVNSGGTAELRITGAAGSQSLLTFYADGAEKWEFFRQATTQGFGIYDNINGVISMEIDPSSKVMSLHNVASVGYVMALGATGAVTRRATLNSTASAAMFEHNRISSTGTPGDGFGAAWEYNMQDDSSNDVPAMEFNLRWATAAHGSRKAQAKWYVLDTDYREALRLEASGSAPMIGFLGAAAAIRQTGGSATAGGTYGATEQTMLQKVYDMGRTFGLLT